MSSVPVGLDLALVHYPVLGKDGRVIGSAVTNLDLHDIARAAATYGIGRYYVATPFVDQRELVDAIVGHWRTGPGSRSNPARRQALELIRSVESLEQAVADTTDRNGSVRPLLICTSARKGTKTIGYRELREQLRQRRSPVLLVFGTAHGLAPEIIDQADALLPPLGGGGDYNHLSVRSAVSIVLDRLLGRQR